MTFILFKLSYLVSIEIVFLITGNKMSRILSTKEWESTYNSFEAHDKLKREQAENIIQLIGAVTKTDRDEVDKLILEGAPLNLSLYGEMTALGAAVENNDLLMVKHLVSRGASVRHRFANGLDASWIAIKSKNNEIFEFLMEMGSPVNLKMSSTGETKLITATQETNSFAVSYLINHKVKINDYDNNGRTALHYNLLKNPYTAEDAAIGRMLLNLGGDPNIEDNDGIPAAALGVLPEHQALLEGYNLNNISTAVMEKVKEITQPEKEEKIDFSNVTAPKITKPLPKPKGRKRL